MTDPDTARQVAALTDAARLADELLEVRLILQRQLDRLLETCPVAQQEELYKSKAYQTALGRIRTLIETGKLLDSIAAQPAERLGGEQGDAELPAEILECTCGNLALALGKQPCPVHAPDVPR